MTRRIESQRDQFPRRVANHHAHPDLAECHRAHGTVHSSCGRIIPGWKLAVADTATQESRLADTTGWTHHVAVPPSPLAIQGARAYSSLKGFDDPHASDYTHIMQDPQRVARVGRHYDSLPVYSPEAVPHFLAMQKEINDQYDFLTRRMGINVQPVDYDPYANVQELMNDIHGNKTLKVLGSHVTGGHPIFGNEGNDKFRAVHDFFGHAATGRDFDRHGEHATYLAHSKMFTPQSLPALTTETLGQNSSLILNGHFGPNKIGTIPRELTAHRTAMPWYHNTDAELNPGDMLLPAAERGHNSRWRGTEDEPYPHYDPHSVYMYNEHGNPNFYQGYGKNRYEVEPIGPIQRDPEWDLNRRQHAEWIAQDEGINADDAYDLFDDEDVDGFADHTAPRARVVRKLNHRTAMPDYTRFIPDIHRLRDEIVAAGETNSAGGPSCGVTAEEVAEMLRGQGVAASENYGSFRHPSGEQPEHAWVNLPGGHILDPTADQFGYEPVRILRPGHPDHARYRDEGGDDHHTAHRTAGWLDDSGNPDWDPPAYDDFHSHDWSDGDDEQEEEEHRVDPVHIESPLFKEHERPRGHDKTLDREIYHFLPHDVNPASDSSSRPWVEFERGGHWNEPSLDLRLPPLQHMTHDRAVTQHFNGQEAIPAHNKGAELYRGLLVDLKHPELAALRRSIYGDEKESEFDGDPARHMKPKRNFEKDGPVQPGMFPGGYSDKDLAAPAAHPDQMHQHLDTLLDHMANHRDWHHMGLHWTTDTKQADDFANITSPYNEENGLLPVRMTGRWFGRGEDPYRRGTGEEYPGDYDYEKEISLLSGAPLSLTNLEYFHPKTQQWHSMMDGDPLRIHAKGKSKTKKKPKPPWSGPKKMWFLTDDGLHHTLEDTIETSGPKQLYQLLRNDNTFAQQYVEHMRQTRNRPQLPATDSQGREFIGMLRRDFPDVMNLLGDL